MSQTFRMRFLLESGLHGGFLVMSLSVLLNYFRDIILSRPTRWMVVLVTPVLCNAAATQPFVVRSIGWGVPDCKKLHYCGLVLSHDSIFSKILITEPCQIAHESRLFDVSCELTVRVFSFPIHSHVMFPYHTYEITAVLLNNIPDNTLPTRWLVVLLTSDPL